MRITKRELLNLIEEAVEKAVAAKDVWPKSVFGFSKPAKVTLKDFTGAMKKKYDLSAVPSGAKPLKSGANYFDAITNNPRNAPEVEQIVGKRKMLTSELTDALGKIEKDKDSHLRVENSNDDPKNPRYSIYTDDTKEAKAEIKDLMKKIDVEEITINGITFYKVAFLTKYSGYKYYSVDHILTTKDEFVLDEVKLKKQQDAKAEAEDVEDGWFAISYFDFPYNNPREYFWTGVYSTRAAAVKAAKQILKRGPRTGDWMKADNNRVTAVRGVDAFNKAAEKFDDLGKLSQREIDNLEFHG